MFDFCGMLRRLGKYINYFLLKLVQPEIIGGWRNADGSFMKNTGISNMTHISQKENNLYIGNNVFIGHFNYIDGYNASLTICDNVEITNYTSILTHSTHNSIRFSLTENIKSVGPVYIGEYSYVGPHSVIMPNTKIGKGCVVSAYSYVKGEFPDYSILRGQPARVVGDTRTIDKELLEKYPDLQSLYYNNENN